ncbi:MAG TPA: cellulase family glycosylhydrolase [Verrucomicrobiae bacterium]|nr:cellulase family glycosylhydrolase [Verrucomicrobiae bacterium]
MPAVRGLCCASFELNTTRIHRREFIKTGAGVALALAGGAWPANSRAAAAGGNPLPRWRGFNLTDFTAPNPFWGHRTTDEELKWIVDWGFNFIRLPVAYPRYLDFDRSRDITPEEVYKIDEREVGKIESFARKAQQHGLHVSLNLHRAPGYCINAGFHEPYDLWRSEEAQKAFYFHWGMWAKRFKDVAPAKISFDLLNEPTMRSDMNDQHASSSAVPGELYRKVAKGATDAIRAFNPAFIILADGNKIGYEVTPELEDLGIAQSCRGYYPHYISHYKAPWANKDPDHAPEPVWPGTMNGQRFDKSKLEAFYRPWIDLVKRGIGVHCGECGCWNKTPHKVFLAWFNDVLDILAENKIGYSLWNFKGDFGILNSGRKDVAYSDWHGNKLDAKLLGLLQRH